MTTYNFDALLGVKEDVCRFEIAMHDVLNVGELKPYDQLGCVVFDKLERQSLHRLDSVCQGAVGAVLEDEVQVVHVLARAIKVNEVAILRQYVCDVSLAHHCIKFALTLHLGLAQLLDGVLLALANHLANSPERAIAQLIRFLELRDLVVLHFARHLVALLTRIG